MTPEQQASMPQYPPRYVAIPIEEARQALITVNACIRAVRDERAARHNLEFPTGHPERRSRVPGWVLDYPAPPT